MPPSLVAVFDCLQRELPIFAMRVALTRDKAVIVGVSHQVSLVLGFDAQLLCASSTPAACVLGSDRAAALLAAHAEGRLSCWTTAEAPYRTRSGSWVTLSELIVPCQQDTGEPVFDFLCTGARESSESNDADTIFYRSVLDEIPALVCRFDRETVLDYVNKPYADYFGKTMTELVGTPWVDLLPEADRPTAMAFVASLAPTNRVKTYDHRVYEKGRIRRWQVWTDYAVFTDDERLVHIYSVGRDHTAEKLQELELIHQSKMASVGLMATGLAHEINQPLNAIALLAQNAKSRLAREQSGPTTVELKLEKIIDQVKRCQRVVDNIRIFGRKPAGAPGLVDVRAAVAMAADLMQNTLSLNGIGLSVDPGEGELWTRGYSSLLEQALVNLVQNSTDAIRQNRVKTAGADQIWIAAYRSGDHAFVSVEDTGGGVPVEYVSRVFDPFFTTKSAGEGTGLGLSIAFGIAQDFGGTIRLEEGTWGARFVLSVKTLDSSQVNGEDERGDGESDRPWLDLVS